MEPQQPPLQEVWYHRKLGVVVRVDGACMCFHFWALVVKGEHHQLPMMFVMYSVARIQQAVLLRKWRRLLEHIGFGSIPSKDCFW